MNLNINPDESVQLRKIIGKHFAETRKSKGMSQANLAEKMGVSRSTVAKIENGSWNFTMDFLFLFCHYLDLYIFLPEKGSNDEMVELIRKLHR